MLKLQTMCPILCILKNHQCTHFLAIFNDSSQHIITHTAAIVLRHDSEIFNCQPTFNCNSTPATTLSGFVTWHTTSESMTSSAAASAVHSASLPNKLQWAAGGLRPPTFQQNLPQPAPRPIQPSAANLCQWCCLRVLVLVSRRLEDTFCGLAQWSCLHVMEVNSDTVRNSLTDAHSDL